MELLKQYDAGMLGNKKDAILAFKLLGPNLKKHVAFKDVFPTFCLLNPSEEEEGVEELLNSNEDWEIPEVSEEQKEFLYREKE